MLKQSNKSLDSIIVINKNELRDILDELQFEDWVNSLEASEEFQLLNLEYNLYHKELIDKKGK